MKATMKVIPLTCGTLGTTESEGCWLLKCFNEIVRVAIVRTSANPHQSLNSSKQPETIRSKNHSYQSMSKSHSSIFPNNSIVLISDFEMFRNPESGWTSFTLNYREKFAKTLRWKESTNRLNSTHGQVTSNIEVQWRLSDSNLEPGDSHYVEWINNLVVDKRKCRTRFRESNPESQFRIQNQSTGFQSSNG